MVATPLLAKRRSAIIAHFKSKYFLCSFAALLLAFVVMMATRLDLQWFWLLLFAASTVPFSPWAADPVKYFR
jgi:hypothetical protein